MKIVITLPTLNEEKIIGQKLDRLFDFCRKELKNYQYLVIVADNGSTDQTVKIIEEKKKKYPNLEYFHLGAAGKGGAIKKAWQNYPGDVNIFMDADLSTELKFIPELIKGIDQEKYHLVIGSRNQKQSITERSIVRSFISWIFNFILKIFFGLEITDAACGFKAVSPKVIKEVIPETKNNDWFFDIELLIVAHHFNFPIKEIPVVWTQEKQRKTKVKILKLSFNYLKEIIKTKARL